MGRFENNNIRDHGEGASDLRELAGRDFARTMASDPENDLFLDYPSIGLSRAFSSPSPSFESPIKIVVTSPSDSPSVAVESIWRRSVAVARASVAETEGERAAEHMEQEFRRVEEALRTVGFQAANIIPAELPHEIEPVHSWNRITSFRNEFITAASRPSGGGDVAVFRPSPARTPTITPMDAETRVSPLMSLEHSPKIVYGGIDYEDYAHFIRAVSAEVRARNDQPTPKARGRNSAASSSASSGTPRPPSTSSKSPTLPKLQNMIKKYLPSSNHSSPSTPPDQIGGQSHYKLRRQGSLPPSSSMTGSDTMSSSSRNSGSSCASPSPLTKKYSGNAIFSSSHSSESLATAGNPTNAGRFRWSLMKGKEGMKNLLGRTTSKLSSSISGSDIGETGDCADGGGVERGGESGGKRAALENDNPFQSLPTSRSRSRLTLSMGKRSSILDLRLTRRSANVEGHDASSGSLSPAQPEGGGQNFLKRLIGAGFKRSTPKKDGKEEVEDEGRARRYSADDMMFSHTQGDGGSQAYDSPSPNGAARNGPAVRLLLGAGKHESPPLQRRNHHHQRAGFRIRPSCHNLTGIARSTSHDGLTSASRTATRLVIGPRQSGVGGAAPCPTRSDSEAGEDAVSTSDSLSTHSFVTDSELSEEDYWLQLEEVERKNAPDDRTQKRRRSRNHLGLSLELGLRLSTGFDVLTRGGADLSPASLSATTPTLSPGSSGSSPLSSVSTTPSSFVSSGSTSEGSGQKLVDQHFLEMLSSSSTISIGRLIKAAAADVDINLLDCDDFLSRTLLDAAPVWSSTPCDDGGDGRGIESGSSSSLRSLASLYEMHALLCTPSSKMIRLLFEAGHSGGNPSLMDEKPIFNMRPCVALAAN